MTHPLFEKQNWTIGELYDAVFAIHDEVSARVFYDDYVTWAKEFAQARYRSQEGAETLVRSNIGWIFGEGMPKSDINMWIKVCGASHPIFGTALPTPDEAFEAGLKYAERHARE